VDLIQISDVGLVVFSLVLFLFLSIAYYLNELPIKILFDYLIYSAGLVSFLGALLYFSSKPSIEVAIHAKKPIFKLSKIHNFFKDFEIDLPKDMRDIYLYQGLFNRKSPQSSGYKHIVGPDPAINTILDAYKMGQDVSGWMQIQNKNLERDVIKSSFRLVGASGSHYEDFIREEDVSSLLRNLSKKLSIESKYLFLCSLYWGRDVNHTIFINNTGDVSLKDILINIPAPVVRFSHARENNILNIDSMDAIPHKIINENNNVRIEIPFLAKNKSIWLGVWTRENQINSEHIQKTFKSKPEINSSEAILWCLSFFLIMSISTIITKNRNS